MKHFKSTFIAISMSLLASTSVTVNAATVSNVGSAATLCKNQVKEKNSDYKSSKLITAKRFKKTFKIKMKVVTEQGKSVVNCEVSRDGTVAYKTS